MSCQSVSFSVQLLTIIFPLGSNGGRQVTLIDSVDVAVAWIDKGGPLGAKFFFIFLNKILQLTHF